MDPHMDMDMDKDKESATKGSHQSDNPYQGSPAGSQLHRTPIHHQNPSQSHHRIASPQLHLHPQPGTSSHPIMSPQQQQQQQQSRSSYYAASPPGHPPSSAATATAASAGPHYRRPSSPGPYSNLPPGAYSAPSASTVPHSHYSANQAYARHPDYAKDEYRYGQQDRRREYEQAELGHDYAPIAYRSSSPSRLHPSRETPAQPVARRTPSAAAPAGYPSHHPPSTHGSIYQGPGQGHEQELHERDHTLRAPRSPSLNRSSHQYTTSGSSRYAARSPSPGPYGSPPGSMSYRHYYEQQQLSRPYRQEYYTSDGEGEMGHHAYGQQQHLTSRGPSYRSWQAGAHEASARDYPAAASLQSAYYPPARQPLPSERYEGAASTLPPRAASPYQSYAPRPTHSTMPADAWPPSRSPEIAPRTALNYRRRSASVDEGIERDKYYPHGYHNPSARPRSGSPPPHAMTPPGARSHSPRQYQYEGGSYRGVAPGYHEPTYIPSRTPSPVRLVPHRSDRKAPAMSIAQLLSDKTSRDVTPEYADQEAGSRSRATYRHPVQDHHIEDPSSAGHQRYDDGPSAQDAASKARYSESARGPGQLADRARMLPTHGGMEQSATSTPYASSSRAVSTAARENSSTANDYELQGASSVPTYTHDDKKTDAGLNEDTQSISEASTRTESWAEAEHGDISSTIDNADKAQSSPMQVKRRPKMEQNKRSAKAKTEENDAPLEEKVKGKRGRKPKVNNPNPLEGPAPPQSSTSSSSAPFRPESMPKATASGVKRQRAVDAATEGSQPVDFEGQYSTENGGENGTRTGPEGSDSDQEDFSQHKDLMSYMLEVHKRGQKVQKAYEKQSSRKRRKLHEKFLAKQEKRLDSIAPADTMDDEEEGFLGTRPPLFEGQSAQAAPTKGKGRGRKKLQPGADSAVKRELDDEGMLKETKAEKKRRERKEAAEAAAMAQVQAIKARARAQENELALQDEGEYEDQDAHVPRSNTYDEESDDQDYGRDRRLDFEVSEDERDASENVVLDEEALARRQEKEYEAKRRAIWDLIAHRQIREMTKIVANVTSIKLQNCKKVAQFCQREARKAAARSVKPSKEVHSKARKVNREMLIFWKRNEREEREMRKKAEKEAIEKLRIEEEMREARRQARKLNFLITQTELYSHFIGKKIGTEAAEADDDSTPVRMQPAKDPAELSILQDPNHTPVEGELDFEKDSDETLEAQAKWGAQQALLAAQERTKTFDAETKDHQEHKPNIALNQTDLDEMNFQNPSSMPTVTEIEQPKMLMCQLKGYQIKGLNWLANLYEQGINGILADEMGLGKTVQSISLMAHLAEAQNIWGPFLVIAPASTLHNWQQEFTKFTPELKALPYWGNINDRKTLRKVWSRKQVYTKDAPFHVLITSYQLVVSDEKYFQRVKWQYMVLDEAQAIKSSSSARWKTLLGFNCRNRLLLTGTPIQNSMQELWALLHFIMPSLFDSHEEFSEWFSKDIESHAENKGTLNEHQLKRLHMILKPFMLRRIKKNVQNELGDKIELEVSCELTARQRALYRGLKEKISISELLEKASSLNDNESVDSLMNLVMQFRKVCNHPELFERADVVSPLALCSFSQTPSIAREGDDLFVAYTTRSRISYSIPKRLYREGGFLRTPSEQSNAGSDTKYLDKLLNIWTPDYIAESMFEEQGAFSFLRFSDYSPGQTSRIFRGHLLDRFAQHLKTAEKRARRGYGLDDAEVEETTYPGHTFAKFLIHETQDPFSLYNQSNLSHTGQLCRILEKSELGEYLPMIEPAYRPKAVAPPIEIICSDRSFLLDQEAQLFDARMRQMLLGVSDFQTEASSQKDVAPLMDLWQVNSGRGLLGEPSLSSGYSTIEVPQMKQLIMDSGKLAVLDKLLVELKAGGHRVLVYFQMTKMIDLMEEYLTYRQYKYLRLDGSSKISDRRDMVTDWQTRPEIFIFLLSTRAGGLGINLTAADTVIFYDSDWNPTVDQQAMDRAHRLGQTRQVTVYRLITRGTIEERILQRAKQKDEIQKVVISGGEFKQNVEFKPREIVSLLLDDDELASKLQEQQLKRKVEEEEAKNSRKGTSKEGVRPNKRSKKEGKEKEKDSKEMSTTASTPSSSAAATPGRAKTLDEMWADLDSQAAAAAAAQSNGSVAEGSTIKGKRGRKEKVPKEPKPKKEPKAKKPPKLGKKAQAAVDAAAAADADAAEAEGEFGETAEDADNDVNIDKMDL
ncbi:putative DNA helicase ino80 [Mortierella sp. GBA30]|nr:putative DNA helicase ino80 [Mortierella sp. GBA30]